MLDTERVTTESLRALADHWNIWAEQYAKPHEQPHYAWYECPACGSLVMVRDGDPCACWDCWELLADKDRLPDVSATRATDGQEESA